MSSLLRYLPSQGLSSKRSFRRDEIRGGVNEADNEQRNTRPCLHSSGILRYLVGRRMLGVVSILPPLGILQSLHLASFTWVTKISCRDVAAGIAILREAGGLITTANPPANPETDPIQEVRLGSRLYLAIRPAGDSGKETGRQAQERVVREVWKRVSGLDYTRPGA